MIFQKSELSYEKSHPFSYQEKQCNKQFHPESPQILKMKCDALFVVLFFLMTKIDVTPYARVQLWFLFF